MALVYQDGFESGAFVAGPGIADTVVGSTSTSTVVRSGTGAKSLRVQPGGVATGITLDTMGPAGKDVIVGHMYFRRSANVAGGRDIAQAKLTTATTFLEIQLDATGHLYIRYSGDASEYGNFLTTLDAWHRIEWKFDMRTNPWRVDWAVDGTSQLGGNISMAADTVDYFAWGIIQASTTGDVYFDDLVLFDNVADYKQGEIIILGATADQAAAADHQSITLSQWGYTDNAFGSFTDFASQTETASRSRIDDLSVGDGVRVNGAPDVIYLDPVTPDVLNEWTKSAGTDSYPLVDDAVRQPTAPTTGSDRLTTTTSGQRTEVSLGTYTKGATITSVTAWWHGKNSHATRATCQLELLTGATQLATTTITSTTETWYSVTYNGDLTQAQIDDLRIRITYAESGSTTALGIINELYVEITAGTANQSIDGNARWPIENPGANDPGTVPLAVSLKTVSREAAAGTNNVTFRTELSGSTTNHFTGDPGWGTTWTYLGSLMTTKPGGGAWANADIDSLNFEIDSTDGDPAIYLGGFLYEISFPVVTTQTYERANIVKVDNSILSGTDNEEWASAGLAISEGMAAGVEAFELSKTGLGKIDDSVLSAVDVAEHGRQNLVMVDASILSGLDVPEYARKNIVIVDASIISGIDEYTATETGSIISEFILSGGEQKALGKKNIAISDSIVSAVDQFTSTETGIVISEGKAAGVGGREFAKQNLAISDFAASGIDEPIFVRQNIVISEFALNGSDASTFNRQNIVISDVVLSAVDQFTATEIGILISDFILSGADAATHERANIVIVDASILSGEDQFTSSETGIAISDFILSGVASKSGTGLFSRAGSVISDFVFGGTENKILNRAGITISDMIVSGADLSTFNRQNIVIIDDSILNGADATTHSRASIVIIDNSKLSGEDQFTSTETGSVISALVASGSGMKLGNFAKVGAVIANLLLFGSDVSIFSETGKIISDVDSSGSKLHEASKTGIVICPLTMFGGEVEIYAESGSVISEGKLSAIKSALRERTGLALSAFSTTAEARTGRGSYGHARSTLRAFGTDVSIHQRQNVIISPALASGKAIAVYTETGIVISPLTLIGSKLRLIPKTGLARSIFQSSGIDQAIHAEAGTILSAISLKGVKTRIAERTGLAKTASILSGLRSIIWPKSGSVKIDESNLSGVKLRLIPRTGKAIATFSAGSDRQHTAVRAAIVKMETLADGSWQIDFSENPELFDNTLLEVAVEAPKLTEAVTPPDTLLDANDAAGGLTAPRITDAKTGR